MEPLQDGVYCVFEWNINNFSCWNREIHGGVIQSPKSCNFESLYFELYPRGIRGYDKHLVVHINLGCWTARGELSYIGPDGSLLCTQQVDSEKNVKKNKSVLKLPPGPNFQEVVSRIKKNEGLQENRLTVRFLMRYSVKFTEYMHTEISVFEVSFKMSCESLKNLDSVEKTHFWICYPQGYKKDKIRLRTFKDKTDSSKIMMRLEPFDFTKNVLVLACMSVLDIEDELVKTEENEHLFLDDKKWSFSITLAKEERKDLKESQTSMILSLKLIPSINNRYSLSVLQFTECKVDIYPSNSFMPHSTKKSLKTVTSNRKEASVTILANELMCLFQDQDFSDFQLKCGDVSIPVHRAILSARSPVFKTMLSTDMQEAASGCMDIVDLDLSTLGLFLTYLYTGAVEELQCERALKLYYAADKYQVPSLKTECFDFLSAKVSISNVCDILSLASKHQDDQLIAVVHEFILNNYNEVLSSDEWMSFMRSEPLLAVETVTHFAQKKYVGKKDTW